MQNDENFERDADGQTWRTIARPGGCRWGHPAIPTTHVVEWPPDLVEFADPQPPEGTRCRTYACADDARRIELFQCSLGVEVTVREVGEGQW